MCSSLFTIRVVNMYVYWNCIVVLIKWEQCEKIGLRILNIPLSLSFILSFVPFAKCTRFLPPFGPFIDVLCSFFFSLSLCFYIETGVKYVHKLYLVFSFFLVRSFTGSYLYILRHSIGSIYGATKTAERTTKQRKKELTHYIVQKEKHTIKKREVKRK